MAQKISYKQLGEDILSPYYHLVYLRQDTVDNQYNQSISVGREKITFHTGQTIDLRIANDIKVVQVLDEFNRVTGIGTVQSYDDTTDEYQMYLLSFGQSDVVIDDTTDSISTVYSSTKVKSLVAEGTTSYYETQGVLSQKMIGNSSVINISDIDIAVKLRDVIYDTDSILGVVTEIDVDAGTLTVETIFSADVRSSLIGVIFETLHDYSKGDIIVRNNKLYQCITPYKSSTDFDTDFISGYWMIMDVMLNGGEII